MRYFRRTGSGCILQEEDGRARFIKGPDAEGPGDIVSYNEAYPDEKRWAEQLAADPYYLEVDRHGDYLRFVPPPPAAVEESTETEPGGEPSVTE